MRYAVLLALALAFVPTAARADEGIALEVYTGSRSADASRLVSPVLDELARGKVSSGDTVGRLVAGISTPSHTDAGMPSDFAQQADAGLRLYAQGKFGDAIQKLVQLVDVAQHNSGAFAKDSKLREPLQKAMIALALAYSHNGDQGAMHATFDEMIRSFPDGQVSRTQYGPEAALAFEESRKALAARGTGKLTVRVTSGVVFVDETYRGSGNMSLDVPPGDYRVVVIANDLPSRTHNVTVTAGSERIVVVDAAFDQVIHTGSWTGFEFASAGARDAHEAEYAARLAHDIAAKSVALVGVDQSKSGGVVVGSLISLESGKEIRRATVSLNPDPSRDRLKALAHYIAGEAPAPGIEVVDVSKQPVHLAPVNDGTVTGTTTTTTQPDLGVSTSTTVDTRWGGWRWLSLGTTVALGGASGVLYALDGRCKGTPPPQGRTCNDVYDNSPYNGYTLIGAVPFAVLTVYLFATQTKTVDARTAALVPVDHGAVATYAFTW
ncbi:MAG: hypothetical protein ABJE66_19185 [Deltaproteobacteria bacterium]